MINPSMRGGGDSGLGVIGDPETGALDHGKIVGPVADRERFLQRHLQIAREFEQRVELGLAAKDRLIDLAGHLAVLDQQGVGMILIEPDHAGNPLRE